MNKIIGAFFIIVGLILIGIGTYEEFSDLGNLLISESKDSNYYDGLYITSGDTITISSQSKDIMDVMINSDLYEFTFNGSYYENKNSGFSILFNDDELTLYRNGEEIRTLHKK